jgi:uncharacterized protein (TIGR02284 family)
MAERTERAVLNHLVETCKDGERGFLSASDHVESPKLKALFEQMARQRGRMAAELEPHAQRLGGESGTEGSGMAALHRRWIDIKSKLKRHDDNAILVEVERGDGITLHAFQEALEGMLAPDTRDVVERLYGELRQAHGAIAAVDRRHAQPT